MEDYSLRHCRDIVEYIFDKAEGCGLAQPSKIDLIKALREAHRAGEMSATPVESYVRRDNQELASENRELREDIQTLIKALAVLAHQLKD